MAYNQQGGQYGDQLHGRTDEYGNPVTQLDQYGNPITTAAGGLAGVGSHQTTTGYGTQTHTGTGYGTGGDTGYGTTTGGGTGIGYGSTEGTAGYGGPTGHHEQKGVMDKIKDNIPGVGGTGGTAYGTTTGGTAYGTAAGGTTGYGGQHHHGDQQKGVMDKIKEKIPGTTESGATGTGYGTTTGGTGTGYGGTHGTGTRGHHEQKGMMDKIKEKIPCATGSTGDTTGGAGYGTGTGQHYTAGGDGRQHHDQYSHGTGTGTGEKKGIVDKIKEKLPGGGTHSDNKY